MGEFKLDILCTSGDDRVIIENQLEKTNHSHLGQLLTYAAGTGAKKVIWVAESFRPEHVAGMEVYIHHAESKKMYQALLVQRSSIEQALGFELDWQELPDAHACRIASWRQDSPIENEAQWGAYLDWFVQRIVKMNAVFRPVLKKPFIPCLRLSKNYVKFINKRRYPSCLHK